jgi:uncharacterized protein (TIGR02453 family)
MDLDQPFTGFPPHATAFFRALERHNTRAWFEAHKDDYVQHVLDPARAFVLDMGDRLRRLAPHIVADPTHNGSIFRLHRDTRFAKDKTPYKTHLGILFWLSPYKKLDGPGFYFELDKTGIGLYTGWYIFEKPALAAFRAAVLDDVRGRALDLAVRRLEKQGFGLGGVGYKRVPRNFREFADHPRARYLKHTGFWTELTCGKPVELHARRLVDYCVSRWRKTLPVFEWLRELRARLD